MVDIFGIGAHFKGGYVLNIYPLYKVHHPNKYPAFSLGAPQLQRQLVTLKCVGIDKHGCYVHRGQPWGLGSLNSPFWEEHGWSTYPPFSKCNPPQKWEGLSVYLINALFNGKPMVFSTKPLESGLISGGEVRGGGRWTSHDKYTSWQLNHDPFRVCFFHRYLVTFVYLPEI